MLEIPDDRKPGISHPGRMIAWCAFGAWLWCFTAVTLALLVRLGEWILSAVF